MRFTYQVTCLLLLVFQINIYAQQDDQFSLKDQQNRNDSMKDKNGNIQVPKPQKDNPQSRLEFELLKVKNPKTGRIPDAIRAKELAFMKSQELKFAGDQLLSAPLVDWANRGPYNVGGRTRALAVDVLSEITILAGGVSGGMWRSTNQGFSWSKTTGSNELQSVTCIAQDTRSGFENIWYYGTGENRGNSAASVGASYLGNGVYKSIDNGLSWTLLESTASNTPQSFENRFDIIHEIVVDPTNGDVYVATFDGLFKSSNGGDTFNLVLGGSLNSEWVDVAVTSTGTLFAALDAEGVFTSTDGDSWTDITPAGMSLIITERKELAIAPSNENIVYLLGEDDTHISEHMLWRFDDSDDSWDDRSGSIPLLGGQTGNFDSQGSYNLLVKVKPDDSDFVLIGGTNLFRSTDGFSTTTNTTWIGGYTADNTSFALYPDHHPDQHSFVFLSGDKAISGNDGGVQITDDITSNFSSNEAVDWDPLNNGYLTTQVYAVSAGPEDQILAGFQDNGTWFTSSTDGTQSWSTPFGGDGAYSAFSSDGTTRYVSSQNGNIYRFEYSSADDETLDAFAFFTPDAYTAGLFIVPFYLDPADDDIFYLAGANDLFVNTSASTGTDLLGWKSIPLGGSGIVSEIGVTNDGFVVAGTFNGELFKVTDPGGSHSVMDITGSNFPTGYISGIDINQFNGDEMIVSFSNYGILSVFHTSDGGTNWTDISGSLEENLDGSGSGPSVRAARILGDGKSYFVGTSTGLYSTDVLDGSSTVWTQEDGDGIGDVVVEHLVMKQDGTLIAGTHGNGVFSAQFSTSSDVIDLELSAITAPRNTSLGSDESVEVLVLNQGNVAITDFNLVLRIDGAEVANEIVNDEISPGEIYYFTFGTTVDLSSKSSYEFDVEVVVPNDSNPDNNRLIETITPVLFVGTYSMEQTAPTTSGVSAFFVGGTLFSGSGTITIDVEYVDEDTRSFEAQYVSQLGFIGDETYFFDLIGGDAIFVDNQGTNVTCSGNEVFLGPADVPGVYDPNDDSNFTLTLKEDITNTCSYGSVDVTFNMTRLDGIEVNVADRNALIALYNATDGPSWTTSWDISASVTEWEGVVLSSEGRVIDLSLPSNNLNGSIPSEIGDLTELVSIVLTGNLLSGEIPSEIGNLTKLTGLVLDDMQLSGTVPEGIWNLTNLERLNLDFNQLEGQVPAAIGNLVNLERLDLDGNNFSGELPAELSTLTDLIILDLDLNSLSGSIPSSLGNLTSLNTLDLSDNLFTGSVPSTFSNLINLDFFDLSANELDELPDLTAIVPGTFNVEENNFDFGDIIPNIGVLTTYAPQNNLETEIFKPTNGDVVSMEVITTDDGNNFYDWAYNGAPFTNGLNPLSILFTGSTEVGTYQCTITNPGAPDLGLVQEFIIVDDAITSHPDYDALEAFYIATDGDNWSNNSNWLTGSNLDDWFGISTDFDGRVSSILMLSNNVSGPLPPEIGDFSNLTNLVLSIDRDESAIPEELGQLISLTNLELYQFTGTIPEEIGNLTALQILVISSFDITGSIPSSFQNLTNMEIFELRCVLSGEIPDVFSSMPNLLQVDLQNNNFTGSVPSSLTSLGSLSSVIVQGNQLSDLPDLTSSSASFHVQNNLLDFGDIVPNISVLSDYQPQENIDESHFEVVNEGGSTTIEVSDLTSGNDYQWYLNGDIINSEISASLTITGFDEEDIGVYFCAITNSSAPDLTLTRNSVTLDINRAPSEILLTSASLEENGEVGAVVGTLSTTDVDSDSHTYSIESSDIFSIGGSLQDELIADVSFNFETTTSTTVEVTVEDDLGVQFTEELTIDIVDANDPPTDITLSSNVITQGEPSGTTIGAFTVVDEDALDSHSFAIGGTDSGSFDIGGGSQDELQSAEVFNEEIKSSYSIEVTTTDSEGAQFTKAFTITIEDSPLGIDDENNLVRIYPNPSNGNFQVIVDQSLINPSWTLTNVGGKEIDLKENVGVQNNVLSFNIRDLGSGIYLLNINSGDQKIVKRIVVE